MPVMREIIIEHGSVILDIEGDTLTGTMLNKNGQIRDVFNIVKRGRVRPVRVKNPWQPIHDISLLTELLLEFNDIAPGSFPKGWRVVSGDRYIERSRYNAHRTLPHLRTQHAHGRRL